MVVLTVVLSLGQSERGADATAAPAAAPGTAQPASGLPQLVQVRDASGRRALLPFAGLSQQALILTFPESCRGRRATVTLHRRLDGRRESTAWIVAHPTVRPDGTVPMAGIVPGSYDVEVQFADGQTFAAAAVRAPGDVPFASPAPPR